MQRMDGTEEKKIRMSLCGLYLCLETNNVVACTFKVDNLTLLDGANLLSLLSFFQLLSSGEFNELFSGSFHVHTVLSRAIVIKGTKNCARCITLSSGCLSWLLAR